MRDHGFGVEPADRERIFEQFERGVSDRSFGGLGLGLWIARQIVSAHGGRIGVERRRRVPARSFSSSCRRERKAPLRILLVDDDAPSAEALRDILERRGPRRPTAENGQVALEALREADVFSVILLDVMMPVMNGYEFREEQLKDPKLASIPVIVLTADGHARLKAAQLKAKHSCRSRSPLRICSA